MYPARKEDTDFILPGPTKRTTIIGRTGSGKTQFGAWLLSNMDVQTRPWVIIDYKRDELLNEIPFIREVSYTEKLNKPGLHIVHSLPSEDEQLEKYLLSIWQRGNTGIYVDEGMMLPDKEALTALLTQGRSKKIPMIMLSQRPVDLSRFVFSESDYFSVFHLNHKLDKKKVEEFTSVNMKQDVPEYHSRWYDVSRNLTFRLRPVPDKDTILDRFEAQLRPRARLL